MLSKDEIKKLMENDKVSKKKKLAMIGQKYYEGNHDIKEYRIYYYNADGELEEDTTRSNNKIAHAFFTELVDQTVQYMLGSDEDGIIKSDNPDLQMYLDKYFNQNEDFMAELSELVEDCQIKGFSYMYTYKNKDNRLAFECADSIGVIEVDAKYTDDKKNYIIYWYVDKIDLENHLVKFIQVWSDKEVCYYKQVNDGDIEDDNCFNGTNSKPHIVYIKNDKNDNKLYGDALGFVPFFRMDNNKKQINALKPVKDLIDDYDLMASSLSNNLIDFDRPIYVVKGFEGDNMDQLFQNLKTKKLIGMESTDTGAGIDVKTVDIPYEARKAKLELDEVNIYRFGMGLNTAGLKDTAATTNIAIKAAYSLLDLKCSKLTIKLKQFLRKIVAVVIDEINKENDTAYNVSDVYFKFKHDVMANAKENEEIERYKAETRQIVINTLLSVADVFDDETLIMKICEQFDIDYKEIKNKIAQQEEEDIQNILDGVMTDE